MRNVLVASLVLASALTVSAQQGVATHGISLKWITPEGSPIKWLSSTSDMSSIHAAVVLENASQKVITSVTVAGAIIPPGTDTPTEWIRKEGIGVTMVPKTAHAMFLAAIPTARLEEAHKKYGPGVTTETAIVEVRFADGTKWAFDTTGRRSISGR